MKKIIVTLAMCFLLVGMEAVAQSPPPPPLPPKQTEANTLTVQNYMQAEILMKAWVEAGDPKRNLDAIAERSYGVLQEMRMDIPMARIAKWINRAKSWLSIGDGIEICLLRIVM